MIDETALQRRLAEEAHSAEMKPGDRLDLGPATLHGAEVGPAGVTCVEGQARNPEA